MLPSTELCAAINGHATACFSWQGRQANDQTLHDGFRLPVKILDHDCSDVSKFYFETYPRWNNLVKKGKAMSIRAILVSISLQLFASTMAISQENPSYDETVSYLRNKLSVTAQEEGLNRQFSSFEELERCVFKYTVSMSGDGFKDATLKEFTISQTFNASNLDLETGVEPKYTFSSIKFNVFDRSFKVNVDLLFESTDPKEVSRISNYPDDPNVSFSTFVCSKTVCTGSGEKEDIELGGFGSLWMEHPGRVFRATQNLIRTCGGHSDPFK